MGLASVLMLYTCIWPARRVVASHSKDNTSLSDQSRSRRALALLQKTEQQATPSRVSHQITNPATLKQRELQTLQQTYSSKRNPGTFACMHCKERNGEMMSSMPTTRPKTSLSCRGKVCVCRRL